MKIFDRITFIRTIFQERRAAAEVSARWAKARWKEPELLADVLRMGGIMTGQPYENGEVADLDPQRLAFEAGRRDMALRLAAMMGLTVSELNSLTGEDNAYQD